MTPAPWWQTAVLYQIYPRSFADSNGDGIGDLQGIRSHLDHLEWLGIDAIWLSPVTVSPNADWGYDVADYRDVDPAYGTLADLDALIADAGARGIRVLMDLVPNHTSDQHAWFVDAKSSREAARRDWYVWADPRSDGTPPNNWVSSFGGPAWTLDEASGQYYLHNFLPEQPDLNWWNDAVRDEFDGILRFWFDRGIAGFRIDVCTMIIKDAELRDNPPATKDDPFIAQVFGQRSVYNSNRPETHEIFRRWRAVTAAYDPPRLLLGETAVEDLPTLAGFYGDGTDELHLAFNFPFIEAPFDAAALRAVVEETERLLPPGAWPVWTGSNHDVSRLATRWAAGDEAKTRLAVMMLLTLRGTPVLYQGDEIALEDGVLQREDLQDPVGVRFWPAYAGRDPERTPLPWTPSGGFTTGVPWLPLAEPERANVEDQRRDAESTLSLTRTLIALRRERQDLRSGASVMFPKEDGVWAWRRGSATTVALNFSDEARRIAGIDGALLASTGDARLDAGLHLGPWQGAIVADA